MKPIDQEFIHRPEIGQYGDCQRAVIASLLELPISEVPHFLQLANGDPSVYWEGLQAFCRSRGYAYMTVPARSGALFCGDDGPIYHEISGPSPRGNGVFHAVVGCNGDVVFDPHPSRAGLAGDPATWEYAYLVAIQPVQAVTSLVANQAELADIQETREVFKDYLDVQEAMNYMEALVAVRAQSALQPGLGQ